MELSDISSKGSCLPVPSAEVLPPLLRQKLSRLLQQRHIPNKTALKGTALNTSAVAPQDRERQYTANELEDELQRVATAIATTQRHIQLGEETYFEETVPHGSIYSGWDGFIDNRDVGSASNGGGNHSSTNPLRRMPHDYRWCSTSHSSTNGIQSAEHSRYLAPPSLEEGTPVTIMTEEEGMAMERQKEQENEASQPAVSAVPNEQEEPNQAQEATEKPPVAEEPEPSEEKKPEKKGKRKAPAAPPVSTRPKRTRK